MISALRHLGATVDITPNTLLIEGLGGTFKATEDVIHCGNSGQVLRFIGALSAHQPNHTILTGDASIRHRRPIEPMLSALRDLGALALSSRGDGFAPIIIRGPLTNAKASLSGADSQPVSGLIIAAAFAPHPIELHVRDPGEKPWIDLTLHWLDKFHIPYVAENYERYALKGGAQIECFDYTVPGDFSSAAFPIAAALITQSELTLSPLNMEDPQGDKEIIPMLQKMGANIEIEGKSITVKKSPHLKGASLDVNPCIDALPILAAIACFAEGETELYNGAIARNKESDRIHAIATELKKMGADIHEKPDGLLIRRSQLKGAHLSTHSDHRIALALSVAALAAKGESLIEGVESIHKSYPTFVLDFAQIGAHIEALP
jgi:3-phosphoshikimate 1-carboxyvinyltransferase